VILMMALWGTGAPRRR